MALYGYGYGRYQRLSENRKNVNIALKAECKNIHRFKSYGQNKSKYKIMDPKYDRSKGSSVCWLRSEYIKECKEMCSP